MIQRYVGSILLASIVTMGLFTVMQTLVAGGRDKLVEQKDRKVLDFVRLKRQEKVETKKREKPEKAPPQNQPPSAPMAVSKSATPVKQQVRSPDAVFRPEMSLAGGPYLGGGPSDADVVPLVRVNPRYPPRANARGIEGWVWLEFTITPQGTTKDIVVLDADPKGYFERAAKNAVKKYKYKPRVENGVPVERPGVQVVISFDLED